MSDTVLRTVGLGKRYQIGGAKQNYRTLRETIVQTAMRPIERIRHPGAATHTSEALWALKGVDIEVARGEVLGIIGRNGAGKSTLLKILSRITEPSEGRVEIRGHVGSLLEVGTGFHSELTGRENIQLSAAILGMSRAQIRHKFDEIVEFSEIGKFLDTPVKRYSSGMYVRLAFAVAAHLDPDILIVDEVLAVGDAEFQRKCLGRMDAMSRDGRTVLYVSHNLESVARLCTRAVLLDRGVVATEGPVASVIESYMRAGVGLATGRSWDGDEGAPGTDVVRLKRIGLLGESGALPGVVEVKQPVGIAIEYEVLKPGYVLVPNIHVSFQGTRVFTALDTSGAMQASRPIGTYRSVAWIPGNLLAEGMSSVDVAISSLTPNVAHCYVSDALTFQVFDDMQGDSARGVYAEPLPGVIRPKLAWDTHPVSNEVHDG